MSNQNLPKKFQFNSRDYLDERMLNGSSVRIADIRKSVIDLVQLKVGFGPKATLKKMQFGSGNLASGLNLQVAKQLITQLIDSGSQTWISQLQNPGLEPAIPKYLRGENW